MIIKSCFGIPVDTGAVCESLKKKTETSDSPVFGSVVSKWPFKWVYTLKKDDRVFGLGENLKGMNKIGGRYSSWCTDCPDHYENVNSLYGAHNFIIIYGENTFALFFDSSSRVDFDIGWSKSDELTVSTEDTGVVVYEITPCKKENESLLESLVYQFRCLIGQSYIAPKWAFGFQQSRWGYKTEEDIRNVVENYRKNNLPLDAVCMDIDYMQDYMDFTVDEKKFPDLKGLSEQLKEEGVRLVPIIDAGVKVKKGYSVYDEGVEKNYFCKKEDEITDFTAGVWPGRSHFPDFFNPEVRSWFGKKYELLTKAGIDGFWNDMNEPAMFYSDESLADVERKVKNTDFSNLDVNSYFQFLSDACGAKNNPEDYRRLYHNYTDDSGFTKRYRHDEVHNMFGGLMTRAASEELKKMYPCERKLLYSRASYIGSHRYGGIWTGDCRSWWSHLEQEIKMLPALNMCGFIYTGADIGGFGEDTTRDLLLRWLSLGVFTPLMRNHSASGTRNQECYVFENTEDFKNVLDLRYALIPYLYSEYMKSVLGNTMYFKPLCFAFPNDEMALETEDELLLGNELLIAPVYKQNAKGRYVYLPEDMTEIRWKKGSAFQNSLSKGIHFVKMALDEVVFFVRNDKMIPLYKPCCHTKDLSKCINDFIPLGNGKSYSLYDDDGISFDVSLQSHITKLFSF